MNESTLERLEFYFTPIDIKKVHPNSMINFDLYIKSGNRFVLYKNRRLEMKQDDISRLVDRELESFYIHVKDKKNFRVYLEDNIEDLLKSEQVPIEKKAEVLHESAINVVEDIFENPRSGEAIQRSKEVIGHTVDFILGSPQSFANLLKIRKHDYYTYTHSVNVCTFLVSLAREIGVSDKKELKAIGEGGLLHDLGKSQVPPSIINKPGKLVKSEWEVMQMHPAYGVEIAKTTREIHKVSLSIIGQHHEKPTGAGYPHGLMDQEMSMFAKMATIVDVYDAITTNRSYSQAKSPMEAAQYLLEHREEFNEKLLLTFIKMLAVK
ncbi:MAG: HD-GYP domain-containing protein [Candidatus Omnitrophota bacterium]